VVCFSELVGLGSGWWVCQSNKVKAERNRIVVIGEPGDFFLDILIISLTDLHYSGNQVLGTRDRTHIAFWGETFQAGCKNVYGGAKARGSFSSN